MIKLKNITKRYNEQIIFEDFNLNITENQITCILGESGVGKTTLLNIIAGITPYQGSVSLIDKVSYIFQEPRLILTMTIEENLKFTSPNASDEDIHSILQMLKIEDKKRMFPNQLSGGEQQRVSIARAFLFDAPIVLMDEPFSSLDLSLKYHLICHFASLWKKTNKTVIFVTHNVDEALWLANEILILSKGKIVQQYNVDEDLPRSLTNQEELRKKIIMNLMKDSN